MGMDLYTYKRSKTGSELTITIPYLEAYKAKFPGDDVVVHRGLAWKHREELTKLPHPEHPEHMWFGEEEDGMYYAKQEYIDARDAAYDKWMSCRWDDDELVEKMEQEFDKNQAILMENSIVRQYPE